MNNKFEKGISVVICCHNSADKISATLQHLQKQLISEHILWEVILVNNASDDLTVYTAQSVWENAPVTELRIVEEDQLGLIFARLRGLDEAKYEFISFIDDDNWIAENWISLLYKVMSDNPQIGACGGFNSAVFEAPPPDWFDRFEKSYAVGQQAPMGGDITEGLGVLCGAGLSIRKSAWVHLQENGFSFSLVGRQGNQLLCGEDYELCLAIKLAGWKIWYEPTLKLEHFMPAGRLNWKHLRRMVRGYGFAKTRLGAYGYGNTGLYEQGGAAWWRIGWRISKSFLKQPIKALFSQVAPFEGDETVIDLDIKVGELKEILTLRQSYSNYFNKVKSARWNSSGYRK